LRIFHIVFQGQNLKAKITHEVLYITELMFYFQCADLQCHGFPQF
jgi:hypothetical protein